MRALQVSLSKANREIVLLPGAERLMDSTACLLRSVHVFCSPLDHTDTLSDLLTIKSSLLNFASTTVAWRIDLERLRDTMPTPASSINLVLTDCVHRLVSVYQHSDRIGMACKLLQNNSSSPTLVAIGSDIKKLSREINELCQSTNLLTSQVIPYLSDRRRALKEKYLAISAIVGIHLHRAISQY